MTSRDFEALLSKTDDNGMIAMTRDLRALLKSEIRRTGLQPRFILKDRTDIPVGLDARSINSWIRGAVKEAYAVHFTYVGRILKDAPSIADLSGAIIHRSKTGPRPVSQGIEKSIVTPEMRTQLIKEIRRTGAKPVDLAKIFEAGQAGLSVGMIRGLSSGNINSVAIGLWNALLNHLASLPNEAAVADKPRTVTASERNKGYRSIRAEEFAALQFERKRTRLSGVELFKRAVDAPAHLNGKMISAWLHQQTRTALPEHIDYALALYRAQADG